MTPKYDIGDILLFKAHSDEYHMFIEDIGTNKVSGITYYMYKYLENDMEYAHPITSIDRNKNIMKVA